MFSLVDAIQMGLSRISMKRKMYLQKVFVDSMLCKQMNEYEKVVHAAVV